MFTHKSRRLRPLDRIWDTLACNFGYREWPGVITTTAWCGRCIDLSNCRSPQHSDSPRLPLLSSYRARFAAVRLPFLPPSAVPKLARPPHQRTDGQQKALGLRGRGGIHVDLCVGFSRFSGKLGCREQHDFRAVLYLRGGNSLSRRKRSSPQSALTF